MSGKAATWRTLRRLPYGWQSPPERPDGPVPVAQDRVKRRGVFEGKRIVTNGKIVEVYPRKASSRTFFRWVARIRWSDGARNEIRIERLLPRRWGWLVISKGKKVWL